MLKISSYLRNKYSSNISISSHIVSQNYFGSYIAEVALHNNTQKRLLIRMNITHSLPLNCLYMPNSSSHSFINKCINAHNFKTRFIIIDGKENYLYTRNVEFFGWSTLLICGKADNPFPLIEIFTPTDKTEHQII